MAMPHLATTPKPQKERLSLVLDFDKKEVREEAEYQSYIESRVMRAYNEMKEHGSQGGVSSAKAKEIVMQRVRERLENNK